MTSKMCRKIAFVVLTFVMFNLIVVNAAGKDLGNWSFYSIPDFTWDSVKNAPASDPKSIFSDLTSPHSVNADSTFVGDGVCFGTYKPGDRNWYASIATFPSNATNRARFLTYKRNNVQSCVATCFTIPTTGKYRVEADMLNIGTAEGLGSDNYARVTILNNGETMENAQNTHTFYIRNKNVAGDVGSYNSDIVTLTQGTKIYLRATSGTDTWGDDFYGIFKITKYDEKQNPICVYDLNQVGVENEKPLCGEGNSFSSTKVIGNSAQLRTCEPVINEWSFSYAPPFYSDANVDKPLSYTYNDVSTFGKAKGIQKRPAVNYSGCDFKREGIVMATSNTPGDRSWGSALEIYPNTSDYVRFIPGYNKVDGVTSAIVTCFTVPKNGNYKVNTNIVNYGWLVNEARGYGSNNMARVSIIPNGEKMETDLNSHDFKIKNVGSVEDIGYYNSEIMALNQGDKIFLRVYCGESWDKDDFFGKHVITETDAGGNAIKVYDLSKASYTTTGDWKMFSSPQNDVNPENYTGIIAFDSAWFNTNSIFSKTGIAASVERTSEQTSLDIRNSVMWSDSDERATVNLLDKDMVISCDITKNGIYIIDSLAQVDTGAEVNINIGKLAVSSSTKEIIPITSYTATTLIKGEKKYVAKLEKGDKIFFRVNKADITTQTKVAMSAKVIESLDANTKYDKDGIEITDFKTIKNGDVINISRYAYQNSGLDMNADFAIALYEGEELKDIKFINNTVLKPGVVQHINAQYTIPQNVDLKTAVIKTFVWNELVPLTDVNQFPNI
ncbi:MAG: hypothetical protein RR957_03045 [Oscillospiraceae bacterium]